MPNIERNGLKIHYEERGRGRPVVLLHGFLFNSEMWAPQLERLREEFRVITIDFRGHGLSSEVTTPFTLYDLVSDVVAVLEACGLDRATWVGLSMGGMVAMRAAIVSPETVEALVLLDTDSGTEDPFARLRYRSMAIGARLIGIRPFLPIVGRLVFGSTTRRERRALVDEWKKRFAELDTRSIRQTLEAITMRDPLGPTLHAIDVPTLVIVGEEDRTLPPGRSRRIAEGIVGSRLAVVPRSGHLSNLERPDVVNELLLDFLGSVPREEPVPDVAAPIAVPRGPEEDEAPRSAPEVDPALESRAGEAPADESHGVREMSPRPPREPLEEYVPSGADRSEAAEFVLSGGRKGRERRGKRRVAPSRKLYGRVGHVGILVVDISESGARIEHYNHRFATRSTITVELEWEGKTLHAECEVMSCKVRRFIPGEKGATVYQSGLLFRRMGSESSARLRELVSRLVTRGLAEQVANARGIGPVLQDDMPTFRAGVVSAGGRPKEAGSEGPSRLIRTSEAVEQTGYIRCRKIGPRWEKKWTVDPKQPRDGFTLLASENKLDIETLCETWDRGDADTRKFLRDCARASIGLESPDPEE